MIKRKFYIENCWVSYPLPPTPEGVVRVSKAHKLETLKWLSRGDLNDTEVPSPELVLEVGDWVWLDISSDQVVLLAPVLEATREEHKVGKASALNPDSSTNTLLFEWPKFLNSVKAYFINKGFLEVDTPSLVTAGSVESLVKPFKVMGHEQSYELPTSPELGLKKVMALCPNAKQIFELKKVYRDDLISKIHSPEFTMVEWYKRGATLSAIIQEALELIAKFTNQPNVPKLLTWSGLFKECLNFDFLPQTNLKDLQSLFMSKSIYFSEDDSFIDLMSRLEIEVFNKKLTQGLVVLRDYHPLMSSLARINKKGWADRAEIYFNGCELANSFQELNEPSEMDSRFVYESKSHELQRDHDFYHLFKAGFPPCAGIALGLDRLFMLATGESSISNFNGVHLFKSFGTRSDQSKF